MRARYTRSRGMPVLDQESGHVLGFLNEPAIDPDAGFIEGFFVNAGGGFLPSRLFLSRHDILHWGVRVTVRHAEVLAPPEELIRLQTLLSEKRPMLGEKIVTESGKVLGKCGDVQFSTTDFRLEWIFPRGFFRWGQPIAVSQIVIVRPDAIVVRDTAEPVKAVTPAELIAPSMPEPA